MVTNIKSTMHISGFLYILKGAKLCFKKGNKRYLILPFFINIIVYTIGLYFLFGSTTAYLNDVFNNHIHEYLSWLSWIVIPIVNIILFIIVIYFFTTIALTIGSPFFTSLAMNVQEELTQEKFADSSFKDTLKEIPPTILLECKKLIYRIPILIVSLILLFIPLFGQILAVLLNSWCLSIDFTSYAFENNKITFKETRQTLVKHKCLLLSFGIGAWAILLIPFLNILMMPIAICGATILWVERIRPDLLKIIEERNSILKFIEVPENR